MQVDVFGFDQALIRIILFVRVKIETAKDAFFDSKFVGDCPFKKEEADHL